MQSWDTGAAAADTGVTADTGVVQRQRRLFTRLFLTATLRESTTQPTSYSYCIRSCYMQIHRPATPAVAVRRKRRPLVRRSGHLASRDASARRQPIRGPCERRLLHHSGPPRRLPACRGIPACQVARATHKRPSFAAYSHSRRGGPQTKAPIHNGAKSLTNWASV
jgi:hypothetical protein